MDSKTSRAFVAFCSPAGATRAAAGTIAGTLKASAMDVASVSLCKDGERETALKNFGRPEGRFRLLFVGSPVYGFHPLPPVMDFIYRLPPLKGVYAVPFVTWGGVCSGSALFEMATALTGKGATLAGALKIPAEHAISWNFPKPFCGGRPNAEDRAKIEAGVTSIHKKVMKGNLSFLTPLEISHYTGEQLTTMLEGGFETSKARFPEIGFDETLCTACGRCAEVCPIGCVALDPIPVIGDDCIRCYNCVKTCPESALLADFSKSEAIMRERVKRLKEPLTTVVFPQGHGNRAI